MKLLLIAGAGAALVIATQMPAAAQSALEQKSLSDFTLQAEISAPSTAYPAAGHTYEQDMGAFKMEHTYPDDKTMTFKSLGGRDAGQSETVAIHVTPIAPDIFLVSWQEKNKSIVVRVEDYAKNVVYSIPVQAGGGPLRQFQGTMKKIR